MSPRRASSSEQTHPAASSTTPVLASVAGTHRLGRATHLTPSLGREVHSGSTVRGTRTSSPSPGRSSEWSSESAREFNVVTRNRRLNPRAQYAEQLDTSSGPEFSMTDDTSDDGVVVRRAHAIGRRCERVKRRREAELDALICLEEKHRREDMAERGRLFLMGFLEAHNRLEHLQDEAEEIAAHLEAAHAPLEGSASPIDGDDARPSAPGSSCQQHHSPGLPEAMKAAIFQDHLEYPWELDPLPKHILVLEPSGTADAARPSSSVEALQTPQC